jgi:beta-glucosidase-like glycosyl hydrolase
MPWKKGIEKGAMSVMGFYSGTYTDTLGVCFSKYYSTELLYNQLGFKGSICSDWFVITMKGVLKPELVGNPIKRPLSDGHRGRGGPVRRGNKP